MSLVPYIPGRLFGCMYAYTHHLPSPLACTCSFLPCTQEFSRWSSYSFVFSPVQPRDVLRVTNGFIADWMPSGYRDVNINLVVNGHLCEIQLQLRQFYALKDNQHDVYVWARELNVTRKMEHRHILENQSREVSTEMIRLAEEDWGGTSRCLFDLRIEAAQYDQVEEGCRKVFRLERWRGALLYSVHEIAVQLTYLHTRLSICQATPVINALLRYSSLGGCVDTIRSPCRAGVVSFPCRSVLYLCIISFLHKSNPVQLYATLKHDTSSAGSPQFKLRGYVLLRVLAPLEHPKFMTRLPRYRNSVRRVPFVASVRS